MKLSRKCSKAALVALCSSMGLMGGLAQACAGMYSDLHNFTGGADGAEPEAPLSADSFGNFYGTAADGGSACADGSEYGCGVIFKLSPSGQVTTVYSFHGGVDGANPATAVTLAHDKLFGVVSGGVSRSPDGVIYSVGTDGRHYQVIHSFVGTDGYQPISRLLPASNGGFFGVMKQGGPQFDNNNFGYGTLYYVVPNGTFRVLHNFLVGSDGIYPNSLLMDSAGNLFGSTLEGGSACASKEGCGVIFEYSVQTGSYTVLYSFENGSDGEKPMLGGIGADGSLYGATSGGVLATHGTLFSLTPDEAGGYTFATLTPIVSNTKGDVPSTPPTVLPDGAIVGLTNYMIYGFENGVFRTLVSFGANAPVGSPMAPLVPGRGGLLYGSGFVGGLYPCYSESGAAFPQGCGEIFTFAPYTSGP